MQHYYFWLLVVLLSLGGEALGAQHLALANTAQIEQPAQQSLADALDRLSEHYNVNIIYDSDLVKGRRTIRLERWSASVTKDLRKIIANHALTYNRLNKSTYTIIRARPQVPTKVEKAAPALVAITGVVVDAETNDPLIGVNVIDLATSKGTITGLDGDFTLEVAEKAKIRFSYLGYLDQEIAIGPETTIKVRLRPNATQLDEVVVVGYG
ncbi:MAG: carboxypeptidase-like regulatory domain-containing protein, partial [Bacteroidota bacterium]